MQQQRLHHRVEEHQRHQLVANPHRRHLPTHARTVRNKRNARKGTREHARVCKSTIKRRLHEKGGVDRAWVLQAAARVPKPKSQPHAAHLEVVVVGLVGCLARAKEGDDELH